MKKRWIPDAVRETQTQFPDLTGSQTYNSLIERETRFPWGRTLQCHHKCFKQISDNFTPKGPKIFIKVATFEEKGNQALLQPAGFS